jgi:hypothetical protein
MVVVVPGLPEGDRLQPGEGAGLIAGDERSPAEEVAERVDAEGGVMQKEHAHGDAEPARSDRLIASLAGDAERVLPLRDPIDNPRHLDPRPPS